MCNYIYRMRSLDALLDGYHELENQEIYFASNDELNDPMEGFRDIFWHGDEIVWKNFLTHYLLCLEHVFSIVLVGGTSIDKSLLNIPVFKGEEDLNTDDYKESFYSMRKAFFSHDLVSKLPKLLAGRNSPIRKKEMVFYLRLIHPLALDSIQSVLLSEGFIKEKVSLPTSFGFGGLGAEKFFDLVNKFNSEVLESKDSLSETVFDLSCNTLMQMQLILEYNHRNEEHNYAKLFIVIKFPEEYLSKIEEMVYPNWYTACFMGDCTNSSSWGKYGYNHTGVCLKFKTKEVNGLNTISLTGVIGCGSNGDIIGNRDYTFEKVNYEDEFVEIDFFKSLGRLSFNKLYSQWYENENNELSSCADWVNDTPIDDWRKQYWENFIKCVTTKTKDWQYENEHRLIINDFFHDYSKKESRKIKYNFDDLEGIIFGIKTPNSDKVKIMEIIEKKCRVSGRKNFNFYQAEYCRKSGQIQPVKLNLLEFENI
ncbi:hypothetical protein Ccar_25895 (plasmid) [Clostridium carboxidivorans P7]|uniref:DUF2971 domain-containing protein n=4 Tax=Clostridium TaxID=1485 RepID=D6MEX6_9CLOT|nr:DUF2971 domain-containing protein [Clostridium carboxidivorans]ADO12127.1 hypothetical protein Ccar_4287 [Clostridium carboxidivorans P7]AKN34262.1 hypothetical protein Ccar_25895 [Clostridium carboxidivorans P7]EFG87517.1 hypothetical protein CLCAR_3052 [Clostridium carboxidivorans P7]